ncbi:MAG: FecR domain-containing protein, partial [Pseudomonas sp.]
MSGEPSRQALIEAARWFVELHSGEADEQQQQQWRTWLHATAEHQQAWARATAMGQRLQGVPGELGLATLNAPRGLDRRQAVKALAVLLGVGAVGMGTWREQPWQVWRADYRTQVGETREVLLADGTQLTLNTASAVNVRLDAEQRLVHLLEGEILIDSGKDPRPLRIQTAEGLVTPLGTRFLVRQQDQHTEVAVFSGQVALLPANGHGPNTVLNAGQRSRFDRQGAMPPSAAVVDQLAWTQGMLIADNLTLADLLTELGRYRHGYLGCSTQIASLRISGAFPLNNSDRALAALEKELPVQVRRM